MFLFPQYRPVTQDSLETKLMAKLLFFGIASVGRDLCRRYARAKRGAPILRMRADAHARYVAREGKNLQIVSRGTSQ